jgi:hypothetical protein
MRTSLDEPWGQVDVHDTEIVVHDLRPERQFNFLVLLHGTLTEAVVHADRRVPLPEEFMSDVNMQAARNVGADQTLDANRRAQQLTDGFRAQT